MIKKNDTVTIIRGADKGKTAKVLEVFPKIGKVLVEGVNVRKRHVRAGRDGRKGEIVDRGMPISISNVAAPKK
jgi:large subunit ribosomal protein L24